jgi:hypothetical protein
MASPSRITRDQVEYAIKVIFDSGEDSLNAEEYRQAKDDPELVSLVWAMHTRLDTSAHPRSTLIDLVATAVYAAMNPKSSEDPTP